MNLTERSWLPMRAKDGASIYCSPSALADPSILDLDLPRADFQGAAYQFLIGLLQTALPPRSHDDWLDRYLEPPTVEELADAFSPLAVAFELEGDGPRFMQDLDPLEEVNSAPVTGLLIDSPGGNGLKKILIISLSGIALRPCAQIVQQLPCLPCRSMHQRVARDTA